MDQNKKHTIDEIKNNFNSQAGKYDDLMVKVVPDYKLMINIVCEIIPFNQNDKLNILDIGFGTGNLTDNVLKDYPNAKITAVDISGEMINQYKKKNGNKNNIEFIINDFNKIDFNADFDVIITSFALHHIRTDQEKGEYYKKIYKWLKPGGVFINADVLISKSKHLQDLYIKKWIDFENKSFSMEDIITIRLKRYYEEDTPSDIVTHSELLKEAGFKEIDIPWKYFNFAVFTGIKR